MLIHHPDAEPVDGVIFLDCHVTEVDLHVMPRLLGDGTRLYDVADGSMLKS